MITKLLIILSIQILSASTPNQDTIQPKNLTTHDTLPDTITVIEIIPDTNSLINQQERTDSDSNFWQDTFRCNVDCSFIIQIITVLIAIIALRLSFRQSKNSNIQAERSYNAFITKSDNQFNVQKATLETIKSQTEKIYSNNNKREFVGYLTDCSTSIELISNYLKDNFSNIVWKVNMKDYVFDLLQPVIKSSTAMKILIVTIEKTDDDFVKAIKICSEMGERKLKDRNDVELLIKDLNCCKLVFEKYINQ